MKIPGVQNKKLVENTMALINQPMDNLATYPAVIQSPEPLVILQSITTASTDRKWHMTAGPGDHSILEKKVKNPVSQVSLPIREY